MSESSPEELPWMNAIPVTRQMMAVAQHHMLATAMRGVVMDRREAFDALQYVLKDFVPDNIAIDDATVVVVTRLQAAAARVKSDDFPVDSLPDGVSFFVIVYGAAADEPLRWNEQEG